MNSCLYHGVLRHRRLQPKTHAFSYGVFMAWLDLDELELLPLDLEVDIVGDARRAVMLPRTVRCH